MEKAFFFDRDGVILEMVFDNDNGIIHTPLHPDQVVLMPGISDVLKETHKAGYKNIIVSNQPNIGLGRLSEELFRATTKRMEEKLRSDGAHIDHSYYCFHHPYAKNPQYRIDCSCRKPKIGLFQQAAKELNLNLNHSWMIGDGVYDVIAGAAAGCKTILLANIYESEYIHMIEQYLDNVKPTYVIKKVQDVINLIGQ